MTVQPVQQENSVILEYLFKIHAKLGIIVHCKHFLSMNISVLLAKQPRVEVNLLLLIVQQLVPPALIAEKEQILLIPHSVIWLIMFVLPDYQELLVQQELLLNLDQAQLQVQVAQRVLLEAIVLEMDQLRFVKWVMFLQVDRNPHAH